MPFPAFWCGFLCMEQVTNEKKILRILVKQNMNRKIARILKEQCHAVRTPAAHNNNLFGNSRKSLGRYNRHCFEAV